MPRLRPIAQQQVVALLVASDPLFFDRREQLVALAAEQAIPAIYYLRAFSQAGGLLSYGNSVTDMYRQVAFSKAKSRRPAGDAGYEVRVGYQPKDREDARPRSPRQAARARRRGH
jgi:putative tryptophan/tyrosine transport system substrate-binding protein